MGEAGIYKILSFQQIQRWIATDGEFRKYHKLASLFSGIRHSTGNFVQVSFKITYMVVQLCKGNLHILLKEYSKMNGNSVGFHVRTVIVSDIG